MVGVSAAHDFAQGPIGGFDRFQEIRWQQMALLDQQGMGGREAAERLPGEAEIGGALPAAAV